MDRQVEAERVIRELGPEIFGWLVSNTGSETEASDAFAIFAESLWKSLARYDGRCAMRTWCYMLGRHALVRVRSARTQDLPLEAAPLSELAAEVRETTLVYLRTQVKDRVRALREHLPPDDQLLLVLRVDKDLGWREIALVMCGPDASGTELDRVAASLRKRFERVKARIRELAIEHGALEPQ